MAEKAKVKIYPFYPKVLALSGVILRGISFYFIFLRPSLLPEDVRYMEANSIEIQAVAPGLARWLQKVYWVTCGYIFSSGLLTLYIAFSSFKAKTRAHFRRSQLPG